MYEIDVRWCTKNIIWKSWYLGITLKWWKYWSFLMYLDMDRIDNLRVTLCKSSRKYALNYQQSRDNAYLCCHIRSSYNSNQSTVPYRMTIAKISSNQQLITRKPIIHSIPYIVGCRIWATLNIPKVVTDICLDLLTASFVTFEFISVAVMFLMMKLFHTCKFCFVFNIWWNI